MVSGIMLSVTTVSRQLHKDNDVRNRNKHRHADNGMLQVSGADFKGCMTQCDRPWAQLYTGRVTYEVHIQQGSEQLLSFGKRPPDF